MKFHMLMLMNEWVMLVLMQCKCQLQCLTLGCYSALLLIAVRLGHGGGNHDDPPLVEHLKL